MPEANLRLGHIWLDRKWFIGFLSLQAGLIVGILLLPIKLLQVMGAGVGGGILLSLLVLYPWIIVPAIIATTALDISGKIIEATALGIPLTGFHLALGLMIIGLALNCFLRRRSEFPPFHLAAPLFMLLGVMAISLTYSPNQPEATIGFMRTLVLTLFLYLTIVMLETRTAITAVVISMALALIAGSVLGVVQIVTERFYLPASFVIAVGANAPRATGTFHNPNTFGTFLMVGVVFLFGILVNYRTGWWKTLLALISLSFGVTGLIVTFSRANWVAAMVGIVVALAFARKLRYFFAVSALGLLAILATKEFVPFAEHIFLRFTSIFTIFEQFGALGRESSSARIYFVFAAFEMFLDNPLLGAGWRAFPILFDDYKSPNFPFWVPTKESHTLFANIMAELGLVGMIAAVWIVWRTVSHGFDALKRMRDPYLRALVTALLSVFFAFQVSLSLTADFSNNFLWMFTGMLFAVIRLDDRTDPA
jgi:O-antigen ligase